CPATARQSLALGGVRPHVRAAARACGAARLQACLLDDVGGRDGRGRAIRHGPSSILLDADRDWLVTGPVEMLDDGCCGGDRDFMLAGSTAVDDADSKLFHVSVLI